MDLRQLAYFVQVAETGSVREAAQRVHVAQSALSRHVRALEDELGVALFERHARGMRLTGAGGRLLSRAAAILETVEETRAELMAEGGRLIGTAAIGTSAAVSRLLYGPLAERFGAAHPQVRLDLVEGASYLLLEGIDTGRLDLAIVVNPDKRASLELSPLVTEPVYLVAQPRERRLPQDIASIEAIVGLPLVLYRRPAGSRIYLERMAAEIGAGLTIAFEAESQDVLRDFVHRGLGFGVLPYSSIQADLKARRLAAVEIAGLSLTRTLVRRANHTPTPAASEFARMVGEEVDGLIRAGVFAPGPAGSAALRRRSGSRAGPPRTC